jgi:hypothetical protein
MPSSSSDGFGTITFRSLISGYVKLQSKLVQDVRKIASSMSQATPGKFLLLQFGMSQVTQIGESISNLISQVSSMIMTAVRNQKSS